MADPGAPCPGSRARPASTQSDWRLADPLPEERGGDLPYLRVQGEGTGAATKYQCQVCGLVRSRHCYYTYCLRLHVAERRLVRRISLAHRKRPRDEGRMGPGSGGEGSAGSSPRIRDALPSPTADSCHAGGDREHHSVDSVGASEGNQYTDQASGGGM